MPLSRRLVLRLASLNREIVGMLLPTSDPPMTSLLAARSLVRLLQQITRWGSNPGNPSAIRRGCSDEGFSLSARAA
jgi:hypothetical protein